MDNEKQIDLLIENNLNYFATKGVSRKPGDLEACLRYRQGLVPSEQQIFDDLLRQGNYAGSAAELVEIYAGRLTEQERQLPPVHV